MKNIFRTIANKVSNLAGSPWVFCLAVLIVATWAVTGPIFDFSDTWQLVINTGTTIVTFLMVFLIQNTQNRDGKAMQLKLDELIRTTTRARDSFIDLEDMSDEELAVINAEFQRLTGIKGSPAIQKLHHKLEVANSQRHPKQSFVQQAGQVAGQVVNMIGHMVDRNDKNGKK